MRNPVSPAQQAAKLLEYCRVEKGLSIAKIASSMGYRSPNSIERIAKGHAGDEAYRKFINQALRAFPELANLLEYQNASPPSDPFWLQFLQGDIVPSQTPITLRRVDGSMLGSIGSHYASMHVSSISVLLLNGFGRSLTADLSALLRLPDAHIHHCLTFPYKGKALTYDMLSLIPFIFDDRYHLSRYTEKATPSSGLLYADIMFVRYQAQAKTCMDMICFTAHNEAKLIHFPAEASLEQFGLDAIKLEQYPIGCRKDLEFHNNYLAYLQWCASLEKNEPIRQIKADICLEQIPVPILSRALREGIASSERDADQVLEIVSEMAKTSNKRWQTWHFHQKEHVHIMHMASLWRFVKTGLMADHFWGLRAFTIPERIAILEELKQAVIDKKYLLLFIPDDILQACGEVICYGNTDLCIIQRDTHYDLSGSHKEILLTDEKISHSFIRFFDDYLVPICQSNADALSTLDEMLSKVRAYL